MPASLDINRHVATRPRIVRRRLFRMFGAMIVTILLIAAIGAAVYGAHLGITKALQHPDFVIRKLVIPNTGVRTVSDQEIKAIAGIKPKMNIYATSLEPIKKRLESHPDIRSVTITRQHPDTLVIQITEREPAAVIKTDGTQPDIPIDRDGLMLSEKKMEHALHLPKLCGLGSVTYRPGSRVAEPRVAGAVRFVDALIHIQKSDFLSIKELRFTQPGSVILETATIPEIRLGAEYSNEKVLRLVRVLEKLREQRVNAKVIDLRFTDVAVIPFIL